VKPRHTVHVLSERRLPSPRNERSGRNEIGKFPLDGRFVARRRDEVQLLSLFADFNNIDKQLITFHCRVQLMRRNPDPIVQCQLQRLRVDTVNLAIDGPFLQASLHLCRSG